MMNLWYYMNTNKKKIFKLYVDGVETSFFYFIGMKRADTGIEERA